MSEATAYKSSNQDQVAWQRSAKKDWNFIRTPDILKLSYTFLNLVLLIIIVCVSIYLRSYFSTAEYFVDLRGR